jgi:hypothetical protein
MKIRPDYVLVPFIQNGVSLQVHFDPTSNQPVIFVELGSGQRTIRRDGIRDLVNNHLGHGFDHVVKLLEAACDVVDLRDA